MKQFTINISLSVDLDEFDLWPDGDQPNNPTAEDVERLIDSCGGPVDIIKDWNLEDGLEFNVDCKVVEESNVVKELRPQSNNETPEAFNMTLNEVEAVYRSRKDRHSAMMAKWMRELIRHRKAFAASEEAYGPVRAGEDWCNEV